MRLASRSHLGHLAVAEIIFRVREMVRHATSICSSFRPTTLGTKAAANLLDESLREESLFILQVVPDFLRHASPNVAQNPDAASDSASEEPSPMSEDEDDK
jgi:hypothetical protein